MANMINCTDQWGIVRSSRNVFRQIRSVYMSEESKSVLGPINNGNAQGKKSNPVESNLEQPVLIRRATEL